MSNLTLMIVGIVGFMVVMYITFVIKSKRIQRAIKLIISGQQDTVVIKQTLEQVKNVINSYFTHVIATGQTIVFQHQHKTFIVTSLSKYEVILSLMPTDEDVEEYAKMEREILSDNIPSETNEDIKKPSFEDVEQKKSTIYKNTPLIKIKALEWMSGAEKALIEGKKNTAIELLMYAFLSLKIDGDVPIKEYIIGTLHYIEDNNLDEAIDNIVYFIEVVSKESDMDIQTFKEHIFNNFNEQFHASEAIITKRKKR